MNDEQLDRLCINTIRFLAVDAVEKAGSGHPGLPMGATPMAYVLWTAFLRHNPTNPGWPGRDRFVLSAGHGSMLLYALLHLTGYQLTLNDLENFRQWGSRTPGHPEYGHTPGVETTTGPLGQGLGNAVGMAMGERFLAARFNRPGLEIVDHYTYCLVSDGDLMEGISHEAASLAGHLRLGRLICLYDANDVSIEGGLGLACSDDATGRFAAYGWHVQTVPDGNDTVAVAAAIAAAREEERPSLIVVRTVIGYGSPGKQGTAAAHGEPLGRAETLLAKEKLGWPGEPPFHVPAAALSRFREAVARGRRWEEEWRELFGRYEAAYPDEADEWRRWQDGGLPDGWEEAIGSFSAGAKDQATRVASGAVLNHLAGVLPNLVGGSADLAPSTKTLISGGGDFSAANYSGRNIHFGVREHAMGAILNGLALHGGLRPFGGTFLVFADYLRPAIRLAALMRLRVVYVFTHDSIGLGEDGPTHQPVEHLASLRAIPGLTVIRPADAAETAAAWRWAVTAAGPVAIVLTRQNVPAVARPPLALPAGLERGAYIIRDAAGASPAAVLIASGSEVGVALAAADLLAADGVGARVVSMPSWELWRAQPDEYRRSVLPPGVPRLAVEAASSLGWREWVGDAGGVVGLDRFGASAPYQTLMSSYGFTAAAVAAAARKLIGRG